MKDPYVILGIPKTASQDEIKKAYRVLVKKNHPDLNPGNKQAEARFKDISVAYDQIGTPEARAKFDRGETPEQQQQYWEEAQKKRGQRGSQKSSFYNTQQDHGRYSQSFGEEFGNSDFFEELFRSTSRQRSKPQKGNDTLYQMEISLGDSVVGIEKIITLPNGKSISVNIPAGINSGTKLRFKGLGDPGPVGAPAGDAFIEVIVAPMKGYKRVGNDIEVEVPISFQEAILGAEISIPTFFGPVKLKIPPGVNTGSRLRIRGKGIQSETEKGSQIVLLKIVIPKNISPKLTEAIKSWHGEFDYNPRESTDYQNRKKDTHNENIHHV